MKKKLLASILVLVMILAMLPTAAFAEESAGTTTPSAPAESSSTEGGGTEGDAGDDAQCAGGEDCDHEAESDGKHYATIQAAIDAAENKTETEVKVLKDVTSTALVALVGANKEIVLDLNGKTITSSYGSYTISVANADASQTAGGSVASNPGKLTIVGSGKIENTHNTSTAVRNYGVMIIGREGDTDFPEIGRDSQPTNTQNSAIKSEETSTLTIYGGTFTGYNRSLQSFGTTTIKGGTFKGTIQAWKCELDVSKLTIEDGNFEGKVTSQLYSGSNTSGAEIEITGGTFTGGVENVDTKATMTITGGTFSTDPSAYVPTTHKAAENVRNKTFEVVPVSGLTGELSTGESGQLVVTVTGAAGKAPDKDDDALAGSATAIKVDASKGPGDTADAEVVIPADTAATMGSIKSLTIEANDVTVKLPTQAMDKIAEAAAGDVDKVKIVVKEGDTTPAGTTYTVSVVSVKDAADTDILPSSAADNGTIEITVPAPEGVEGSAFVYYVVGGKPVEKVAEVTPKGGKVTFTTTHLSDYLVTKTAAALAAIEAPLADHPATGEPKPVEDLGTVTVDVTAADVSTVSVTVTGDNIVAHTNADNTLGTWVGFGMPVEDGKTYSYTCKRPGDGTASSVAGPVDRIITVDGAKYATIYFDTEGEYEVKQTQGDNTVTYTVTVVINEKIDPVTVLDAPLVDNPTGSDTAKTNLGTVTVSTATGTQSAGVKTYKFTLTGKNLVKHKNADGDEAYWVGVGLEQVAGSTYAWGFGELPASIDDSAYGSATNTMTEDDTTYDTLYWGWTTEAKLKAADKGWIAVKKTDQTTTYYIVTFKLSTKSSGSSSGGSGGGSSSAATNVTVPGTNGGKVSVSDNNAKKGDTVTITTTPNIGKKVDTVTVTDAKGDKIAVTDAGDGKYTFVMPDGKVTVKVTFVDDSAAGKTVFTDVPADAYYSDAVAWAVEKGITNGTGANTFSPEAPCTRGQIVTFLWRAAGSPKASGTNPFTDVKETDYYYDAVLWAVEKGITNGTGENTFSPADTCTRGQTVTFLYRYAGQPAAAGSNPFVDVAAGAYYTDAVLWAVEKGITNGTGADTFSPANTCTRGQIVTFLYRDLAK